MFLSRLRCITTPFLQVSSTLTRTLRIVKWDICDRLTWSELYVYSTVQLLQGILIMGAADLTCIHDVVSLTLRGPLREVECSLKQRIDLA